MDKQIEIKRGGMVDLLNQEMNELQAHQKQIEEMAKVIEEAMAKARRTLGGHNNIAMFYAKMLSNEGYCKIPEGARIFIPDGQMVLLTMEEYNNLEQKIADLRYDADFTRKETAEKLLNKVDYESNGQTKAITDLLRKEYGVETK